MDKDIERLGKERLGRQKKHKKWILLTIMLSVIALSASVYNLIQPAHAATTSDGKEAADLSTYITDKSTFSSASYDKTTNTVTASLETYFSIPINAIGSSNSASEDASLNLYYYYDLPDGITVPDNLLNTTDYAYDEDDNITRVFSYKYVKTTDGNGKTIYRVEITLLEDYYESHKTGSEIYGYFFLKESIGADKFDDSGEYTQTMGNASATVSMDNVTHSKNETIDRDLTAFKSYSGIESNETGTYLKYTLTVQSEYGTGDDSISITDVLSYSGFTVDGITVDSVGTDTWGGSYLDTSKYSAVPDPDNSSSGEYHTIFTLPALSANGTYVINYRYKISDLTESLTSPAKESNSATVSSGEDWKRIYTVAETGTQKVSRDLVKKTGTYNSSTKEIEWKITVNTAKADISNYILTDDAFADAQNLVVTCITDGNDNNAEIVKDSNGKITGVSFNKNNMASNNNTYEVTYTTSATEYGTYDNTAYICSDGTKIQQAVASVPVQEQVQVQEGTLTKKAGAAGTAVESGEGDNRILTIPWTTTITITDSGILNGTVYYDELGNSQWFTSDQIDSIYQQLAGFWEADNFTFTIYESANWSAITYNGTKSELDSNLKYYKFEVKFTNALTPENKTFELEYTSTAAIPDSATVSSWTFGNTASFGNKGGYDSYTYKKAVIKKDGTAKTTGTQNETVSAGGTTSWIIQISTESALLGEGGCLTLTDQIPDGLKLAGLGISTDISSSQNKFTSVSIGDSENGTAEISGTYNVSNIDISANGSYNENTNTVNVTFSGALEKITNGYLYVEVTCTVTDKFFADVTAGDTYKPVSNTASVTFGNDKTYSSNTQTKNLIQPKNVEKNFYSSEANGKGRLNYAVVINPNGDKISDDGTLVLEDVLTYWPTIQVWNDAKGRADNANYSVTLILDSVKLWVADGNGEFGIDESGNVTYGKELGNNEWHYTYTESVSYGTYYDTIKVTVPDGQKLILTYTYQVDSDVKDADYTTSITNTAKLTGKKTETSKAGGYVTWKVATEQSGGGSDKSYTIRKVEKDWWNKTLSGAEFTLYKYNVETNEFESTELKYTTSGGKFSINYNNDQATYDYTYNTAYMLMETKAPDGYVLPAEEERGTYYFYFSNPDGDTTNVDTNGMPDGFLTDTSKYNNVVDVTTTSSTAVVENTPALTVKKEWTNLDGTALTEDYYSDLVVTAKLQQYVDGVETGFSIDDITLNSENEWTCSNQSLPTTDAEGRVYTYKVEEISVTKGDGSENLKGEYEVVYKNNKGISAGTITIVNKKDTSYSLPKTGGTGRNSLYMFGGLLALGAGFLLIYKKHKII
jgi:LPXTG-motif cell wall-anchored protein